MTETRGWIRQVQRVEPPELWDEAVGRARAQAPDRSRRQLGRARGGPRLAPRLAALATGVAVGALALALVVIAFRSAPEDRGRNTATEPTRLPPITLEASLDAEPMRETEVAFLPSGDAESEVGFVFCPDCELPAPAAFVVDRDGSYWVADTHKGRIAHFAPDASFLGAIALEAGPADLVSVGDRMYALLTEGGSKVVAVDEGGPGDPIIVNDGGKALDVVALIGGQDRLLVLVQGAERLLGGYWALATVDPATGQVTKAPGVRAPGGTYVNLVPNLDERPVTYDVERSDGANVTTEQELRFQLVDLGRRPPTTVGDTYVRTATSDGVATALSIGDGQGDVQGVWYLEIPADGGPPVFEQFPTYSFVGSIIRSITLGPDGAVYWMRLLEDGLHIYRR
jgi:hypothetical protein